MIPSIQQLVQQFSELLAQDPSAGLPGEEPESSPEDQTSADSDAQQVPATDASEPAPPSSPIRTLDYATRGCHLDVTVSPAQVVAAAELMDQNGFAIDAVTGVDWMAEDQMEVVYDFFHPLGNLRVAIRARIPRPQPEISTISNVFPGANWHERETHDFFGIKFLGHPDLSPFLLPEDADYHPLRKDFKA